EYDDAYKSYIQGRIDAKNKLAADAKAVAQATKDGIDDAASNDIDSHQSKYPGDTGASTDAANKQKQAYSNAKEAFNKGYADDEGYVATAQTNNQGDAYNTGRAVRAAVKDAESGINNVTDAQNNSASAYNKDYRPGTIWTEGQKQAYQNGLQAYQDGLNSNQQAARREPDTTQNKAYQAGQAYEQGIHDAEQGNSNSASKYAGDSTASNAYNTAQQAYNDGLNGKTDTANAKNSPEANKAGSATRDGIHDAEQGNSNSAPKYAGDSTASNAYNTAQQAYNDGLNGKTDTANAKNSPEANKAGSATRDGIHDAEQGNSNSASKYAGDSTASNAYNTAQNAYNAGKNGDNSSTTAKSNSAANNDGYNKYTNSNNSNNSYIPSTPSNSDKDKGSNNFINGNSNNENNHSAAYNNGYDRSQQGFNDGINNKPNMNPTDNSYNNGYQAAKNYQRGESDASRGIPRDNNGSYAYNSGYDAYEDGHNNKARNDSGMNNSYKKAYNDAYNNGKTHAANKNRNSLKSKKNIKHKSNQILRATRAGYKRGSALDSPAKLIGRSKAYKNAYMKAYIRAIKRDIPRYVYNLKKIYRHSKPTLTRKTRNAKYIKTSLRNRHTFRVYGYGFTPGRHLVFRVKGGWISAAKSSIADLYYRRSEKKHDQKVRVIRNHGTYIYNNKHFDRHNEVKYLHTGQIVHIKKLEKSGHITRFYLGDGKYLSSNKKIVHRIN
ncbi:DUF5776 domain-containing protein, partial [Apilactobacillus quenuiae]|uniref:DUF5776 domain-containing protein n=1 Tax=Apilactobacillus quenuiae TaxID=2008377 RepID=UPI0013000779